MTPDLRGCFESGFSHCRDAPWGVSEAEKMACFATERPRDLGDCEADLTAPETPHGASLQWGVNNAESPPSEAFPSLLSLEPLIAL